MIEEIHAYLDLTARHIQQGKTPPFFTIQNQLADVKLMARFFILMGVSGADKTTVGKALTAELNCPFYDADDFHPPENVAKMSTGSPLADSDRDPWLTAMAEPISKHLSQEQVGVLVCSALKKQYRDRLRVGPDTQFIFLDGSFELVWSRMEARQGHFMKSAMLRSQFETLEMSGEDEAIRISVDQDTGEVLREILNTIEPP